MEQSHETHSHAAHTSPWLVFAVLAVLTVIEVAISLVPGWVKNPLLLALSLVKASLVVLYYMHLRYEKPIYFLIFVSPTIMAVLLATILLNG